VIVSGREGEFLPRMAAQLPKHSCTGRLAPRSLVCCGSIYVPSPQLLSCDRRVWFSKISVDSTSSTQSIFAMHLFAHTTLLVHNLQQNDRELCWLSRKLHVTFFSQWPETSLKFGGPIYKKKNLKIYIKTVLRLRFVKLL